MSFIASNDMIGTNQIIKLIQRFGGKFEENFPMV